jgi:hypothetical protein
MLWIDVRMVGHHTEAATGIANASGSWTSGNWCTAQYSAAQGMWYWEYMNFGGIFGGPSGVPQSVFHVPINPDPNVYGAGIPTGAPYNTTIYGVYVPPPPPPLPWWFWLPPQTGGWAG